MDSLYVTPYTGPLYQVLAATIDYLDRGEGKDEEGLTLYKMAQAQLEYAIEELLPGYTRTVCMKGEKLCITGCFQEKTFTITVTPDLINDIRLKISRRAAWPSSDTVLYIADAYRTALLKTVDSRELAGYIMQRMEAKDECKAAV